MKRFTRALPLLLAAGLQLLPLLRNIVTAPRSHLQLRDYPALDHWIQRRAGGIRRLFGSHQLFHIYKYLHRNSRRPIYQ